MGIDALPMDSQWTTNLWCFHCVNTGEQQAIAHVHASDESSWLISASWLSNQQQYHDCLIAAALVCYCLGVGVLPRVCSASSLLVCKLNA